MRHILLSLGQTSSKTGVYTSFLLPNEVWIQMRDNAKAYGLEIDDDTVGSFRFLPRKEVSNE